MRLRTYLIKRAIHTVITLVVVLVLLFVLFRLMPGDPTRFFQRPNQTQEDREDILVQFGFSKRVPEPGNGYRAIFVPNVDGPYVINVTVDPLDGQDFTLYAAYTNLVPTPSQYYLAAGEVTKGGVSDIWDYHPGDTLHVEAGFARPLGVLGWDTVNATATVSSPYIPGTVTFDMGTATLSAQGTHNFSADFPTGGLSPGVYRLAITVTDQANTSRAYTSSLAFPLNPPDLGSFAMPVDEWHLRVYKFRPLPGDRRVAVVVNMTHPSGIAGSKADIIAPNGVVSTQDMPHPTIVVRNNILEEFVVYMRNMLVLDFGNSFYTRQPVWNEIAKRVGPTLLLFGSSLIIGALLGIGIGAVMAWRRGSRLELGTIVVTLFFNSMPVFWLGLVLVWFFAHSLNLFPLGGYSDLDPRTYCHIITGECVGWPGYVKDILWHMTLPLANLIIIGLAGSILLMRNSMLEVMGEDYIMTARAKGLSERSIMYRHAARNAMLPVVTSIALSVGGVISGGVLTETIFTWPGMGYFLVTSVLSQDFPAVQGAFYLLALITIISNMVADVMYAFLDPRVRL
jgi:peptide/nickel transport system permease protein